MNISRRNIGLLVLVLLAVVVGVRFADLGDSQSIPAKTTDATPEEEVTTAIRRTADMDHTVNGQLERDTTSTTTEQILRIQNSRERYLTVLREVNANGTTEWSAATFGTEGTGWTNHNYGSSGRWSENHPVRYRGPRSIVAPTVVEQTDFTVVVENRTTLAIEIENDAVTSEAISGTFVHDSIAEPRSGTLTIVIDRKTQTLSRVERVSYGQHNDTASELTYVYTDVGETQVKRPAGVSLTVREVVGDVRYG